MYFSRPLKKGILIAGKANPLNYKPEIWKPYLNQEICSKIFSVLCGSLQSCVIQYILKCVVRCTLSYTLTSWLVWRRYWWFLWIYYMLLLETSKPNSSGLKHTTQGTVFGCLQLIMWLFYDYGIVQRVYMHVYVNPQPHVYFSSETTRYFSIKLGQKYI